MNTGAGQPEAQENPLCPARVHNVGKLFIPKLFKKDDSFLPTSRPEEKFKARRREQTMGVTTSLQTSVAEQLWIHQDRPMQRSLV